MSPDTSIVSVTPILGLQIHYISCSFPQQETSLSILVQLLPSSFYSSPPHTHTPLPPIPSPDTISSATWDNLAHSCQRSLTAFHPFLAISLGVSSHLIVGQSTITLSHATQQRETNATVSEEGSFESHIPWKSYWSLKVLPEPNLTLLLKTNTAILWKLTCNHFCDTPPQTALWLNSHIWELRVCY